MRVKLESGVTCPEREPSIESSTAFTNDGASSAPSGSGLTASVSLNSAQADGPANVKTVKTRAFELDGWILEDFGGQTGHAIGRSVQKGDLQICLTVGETDGSEGESPPERVSKWLMTGEIF